MSYEAVLFDMDGVLLQGAETVSWIYETAASKTLTDFDVSVDAQNVPTLTEFHYTSAMQSTCDQLGLSVEEFWERREAYAAKLENQQLRNGGRRPFSDVKTLEQLADSHKLGVVSNNRQATVDEMLSVCGLEFIDVAIGRDHSLTGYYDRKPEPTMLNDALRTLEVDHALYVGDSTKDITAAARAGIDSAFIRRSHNANLDLQEEPNVEIEGLADLSEHIAIG